MQWAILSTSVLLLIGFVLRARLRFLQFLFIPASVIGGLVGLALVQALGPQVTQLEEIATTLRGWPGPLIAVVFTGLLLEKPEKRFVDAMRGAALAGIMVWIIAIGEIILGLLATWLILAPQFDLPQYFGQLIEAGFVGGHGTASALGTIYRETLDSPEGLDLGLFMATVGLIYSVISGIAFVNLAVRRGWTRSGRIDIQLISGLERRRAPKPAAFARVGAEVIDPLVFQLVIVAVAFLIGVLMQRAFIEVAGLVFSEVAMGYVENVPLFLFTLLGGWALRHIMTLLGVDDLIDPESIKRIVAIAMEFLIVAAIASLRIEVVAAYFTPLLVLCLLGFLWTAVCLLVIAPRILPRAYWFELGLINYGMSTGTTAQGMMLLRIVDPDLESGAAEDYALAAPLSAPFIGGGVITMILPLILDRGGAPVTIGIGAAAIIGLYLLGLWMNSRRSLG